MLSIGFLTVVYWLLAILSVFLGCVYQLVRIDRARHMTRPPDLDSAQEGYGGIRFAARQAPIFAGKDTEFVARLNRVMSLIQSGDIIKFSGRSFFAWLIRIARYSDTSHIGILDVDDEGVVWIIDSCEGVGVSRRKLEDAVKKYPGQWYWGIIRPELEGGYARDKVIHHAREEAAKHVKYGWAGIILQASLHLPVLRELAYFLQVDRLPLFKWHKFCSQFIKDEVRRGHLDLVPRRVGQLVAPQDINQSAAIKQWVALLP